MKSFFISHWTQNTFPFSQKLNECGIFYPWAASQQTNHDSTDSWVICHWKPKRLYEDGATICVHQQQQLHCVGCQLFPQMSLLASTVSGSQWLPLCLAATPHWCYATLGQSAFWVFLSPPVCCLRVRGAINKHCAFMVRSCVAQQCLYYILHYIDDVLTEYTNLHVYESPIRHYSTYFYLYDIWGKIDIFCSIVNNINAQHRL